MKRTELKRWFGAGSVVAVALLVGVAILHPSVSMAQPAPGSIHGMVTNPAGMALGKGEVRLTTDRATDPKSRKYAYTFQLDANGNYKGTGIAPGDYLVIVFADDKSLDFIDSVKVAAGDDKVVNFDMTRKEYVDKMTPEERKALEEYKKQAAAQIAANSKIQNLNAMLVQARADTKAGNFDPAIKAMQTATVTKPDEAILWIALADAQLGNADAQVKAGKAQGKTAKDPALAQNYTDAIASYKKAIELNAASKKVSPDIAGTAYNQMGQAYAKLGSPKESSESYELAVKAQPAQSGMYYNNEMITLYNVYQTTGSKDDGAALVAAADRAIAADPKKADAYYYKSQGLAASIGSVTSADGKTTTYTAPPGLVDTINKYLDLEPNSPHAAELKGLLTELGEKIESKYKAPKK